MEFEYSEGKIVFNRELTNLDKLVLKFCDILHRLNIRYVIISGYITILFGRVRMTDDVDLFIEELPIERVIELWNLLEKEGFEGVCTFTPEEAFETLNDKTSIRFALKGTWKPNFELKFPASPSSIYSLRKKVLVILNGRELYTSEIEMQIAYKLRMTGDKDLEDALHLYSVFKEQLDLSLLEFHMQDLGVPRERAEQLWKSGKK
ncbi:MAG: hypothetical protein V1776_04555 [Candidatus Diapherotrites archaeon]